MVGIYAKIRNEQWIRALTIPLEDIQRLSYKPLKWLRFVAFAALGAEGNLHYDDSGDDGTIVAYETVTGFAESYYFFPEGSLRPIDPQGLDDRTSTTSSSRLRSFQESVVQRDGNCCVVTGDAGYQCAHIIPHSKGDQYIQHIISSRRSLYDLEGLEDPDLGIDSPENGMLLRDDLHKRFGVGRSAILMTPNFAMVPGDIPIVERGELHPRVEGGEIPPSRTTFQHLDPPNRFVPPQMDIIPDWSIEDTNAPLRLLLDYTYGVAVIKRWASEEVRKLLSSRHKKDYREKLKQLKKKKSSRSTHTNSDDAKPDLDHPTTHRYNLRRPRVRTDHMSKPEDSEMSRAMDTAFQFVLLFSGPEPYQPGTTFESMQKQQEEEARMHSQQIAREKVEEWLGTSESFPVLMVMD